jgi:hypothetical protein
MPVIGVENAPPLGSSSLAEQGELDLGLPRLAPEGGGPLPNESSGMGNLFVALEHANSVLGFAQASQESVFRALVLDRVLQGLGVTKDLAFREGLGVTKDLAFRRLAPGRSVPSRLWLRRLAAVAIHTAAVNRRECQST